MAKRRQRGGDDQMNDITSNILVLFSGATTGILSLIVIILSYLNYELPVRIVTGIYGLFLLIFSGGVIMTDTTMANEYYKNNATDKGSNYNTWNQSYKDIHSFMVMDRIPFGVLVILSMGIIVLAVIYKHYTIFLPITVGIILSIVIIRFIRVPLETSSPYFIIPNIVLAVCAFSFYLITLFNQLYINTDGGGGGGKTYE